MWLASCCSLARVFLVTSVPLLRNVPRRAKLCKGFVDVAQFLMSQRTSFFVSLVRSALALR
jgi:hypothetical protein